MKIVMETVGLFAENTYFLVHEPSLEAVVIDPGDEGERLGAIITREGWKVRYILNTHAHLDHVGAVAAIKELTGAPFHLHESERMLLEGIPAQAAFFGVPAPPVPEVDGDLVEGQVLRLGEGDGAPLEIRVLETPGHSPGGVSLVVADRVFVGDVLFQGSVGRTDLPGGNFETLAESIREKLFQLPEETRLYPGHGPETTVGHEKRTNPFVGGG